MPQSPIDVYGLPPSFPPRGTSASNPTSPSHQHEPKKKKFHPLRAMRRMFRRKKYSRDDGDSDDNVTRKSRSTSELLNVDSAESRAMANRDGSGPYSTRLSLSHDSIFTSDNDVEPIHGSSLSIQEIAMRGFKDELFNRIRPRRDSEEDMGLPRSPCTSPTTADVLARGLKGKSSKSRSTWSDGSLISMGSSENDEDSMFSHMSSHHSSHASLLDRRAFTPDGDVDVSTPVPLNHEAAHHKIAIRPKKTRAAGRHRRLQQLSSVAGLPATPEVEEVVASSSGKACEETKTITSSDRIQTSNTVAFKEVAGVSSSVEVDPDHVPNSLDLKSVTSTESAFCCTRSTKSSSVSKSPRTTSMHHNENVNESDSSPVSRSKSTAAELKLRHEINQFSKRMAERNDTSVSREYHIVCDVDKKEKQTSKVMITKNDASATTEQVVAASWLAGVRDTSNIESKVDEPIRSPEFNGKNNKFKFGAKKKETKCEHHEITSDPKQNEEQPFLSRLFGSRRSARKTKKKEDDKLSPVEKEHSVDMSLASTDLTPVQQTVKSKLDKGEPQSNLFELRIYDSEPGSRMIDEKSDGPLAGERDVANQPDVRLKSMSPKNVKSAGGDDNEFMRRYRKISENSERKNILMKRSSCEIVYQSNASPAKSPDRSRSSRSDCGEMKSETNSSDSQSVQFRILPGEEASTCNDSEHSDCSLAPGASPVPKTGSEFQIDESEITNDVEITEIIDSNANITKIPVSKVNSQTKSPLRESQPEDNKLPTVETFQEQQKGKDSGKTGESELLRMFAKLSQKQENNCDKENVMEKTGNDVVRSKNSAAKLAAKHSTGDTITSAVNLSKSSSRAQSQTPPEKTPVVIEIKKDADPCDVKKFTKLTKQDSMTASDSVSCGGPTPQWMAIAQQRREKREKREKNVFGEQSSSFVIENSSSKSNQRSSKVMDMVSSFQKLQVT